jgi:multisubunit Na+/H+ antiporter MnhE subunit
MISGPHYLLTYEMALKSTMLNLCGIVVAIFKMATGRNFLMSGINPGHHYHIEKFLLITIFKMAVTISQKFNIVRYHHNLECG